MLGDELREARERRGLTIRETSRLSGLAPETISSVERGTRYPTLRTLECLAEILQMRVIINSKETTIELE